MKKTSRIFVINRTKETEEIFDAYMHMDLIEKESAKFIKKLARLHKEFDYKKSVFWDMVENKLNLHDAQLSISKDTNFDKIVIKERDENDGPNFAEFLKKMLGGE